MQISSRFLNNYNPQRYIKTKTFNSNNRSCSIDYEKLQQENSDMKKHIINNEKEIYNLKVIVQHVLKKQENQIEVYLI